jgi:hypothetical protein
MELADTQQQWLLERLRLAGEQPVAFAELHAGGIDFPAAVVSELEPNGYAIERVYDHGRMIGVRLFGPERPEAPPAAPAPAAAPIASRPHTPRSPQIAPAASRQASYQWSLLPLRVVAVAGQFDPGLVLPVARQ